MSRLLVVGAGASIEECRRSGNRPADPTWSFPTIANFCNKLFDPSSSVLLEVTASYLRENGIPFDPRLLSLKPGDSFTGDDLQAGPTGVFRRLERENWREHNIETLCEHVWRTFGSDTGIWSAFAHDGIYHYLFTIFTEQFGLGLGRPMHAGVAVGERLRAGEDAVINLNYDIAFDLALKQAGKAICYSPERRERTIAIYKPHGSFNLYVNLSNGNSFFEEPDKIPGSVGFPDPDGGTFFAQDGIIPPRLNKSYEQHPSAEIILSQGRPFSPQVLSFWGVGLTTSDIDLLSIYREAAQTAVMIEFINPSQEAVDNARAVLGKAVTHYPTLDHWLSVTAVA